MAAPYYTLADKNDRAVVAYLISVGLGNRSNIVTALEVADRVVENDGLVTIRTDDGRPEDAPGNYRFNVTVEIKYPAKASPDDPDPNTQIIAMRARMSAIFDKLMLSDDEHTLDYTRRQINAAGRAWAVAVDESEEAVAFEAEHADMVDYTCIWWQNVGFSSPAQANNLFVATGHFESLCCAANVD